MNLKEQYEQETGKDPVSEYGFDLNNYKYTHKYVQWLESKVLSQTPQPDNNAIQRVLAKLEAHKDHYGRQYPQLETWLKAELQTQPEPFWNDSQVINFVNWYIELHKLDSRYELENQLILDSFKAGDDVAKWEALPEEFRKING